MSTRIWHRYDHTLAMPSPEYASRMVVLIENATPWEVRALAERGAIVVAAAPHPGALPQHPNIVPAQVVEKPEGSVAEFITIPARARALVLRPREPMPIAIGSLLHLRPCSQHPGERATVWGSEPCDCREYQKNPIDWIIVDGPRGPGAWAMRPAWIRELRDIAKRASVPFSFLGWGTWTPHPPTCHALEDVALFSSDNGKDPVYLADLAEDRRENWAEGERGDEYLYRNGLHENMLDGAVIDERPEFAR